MSATSRATSLPQRVLDLLRARSQLTVKMIAEQLGEHPRDVLRVLNAGRGVVFIRVVIGDEKRPVARWSAR